MKVKLVKDHSDYHLVDDTNFIIGTTDKGMLSCTDKHKLSPRNCRAIERGYDLDELFQREIDELMFTGNLEDPSEYRSGMYNGASILLKLMGDKKFILSEKDLHKVIDMARLQGEESFLVKHSNEEIIQSLQQTEWDVEIEMGKVESYKDKMGNVRTEKTFPTLDADGYLILKLKSE